MPSPAGGRDGSSSDNGAAIIIVGGGYSAATFAIQLIRAAQAPLSITIVEPREEIGRGLAYSATDPDHRLNGPVDSHGLDPARPAELLDWCNDSGLTKQDPECVGPAGHMFLRRRDFGAYVSEMVRLHSNDHRSGSRIHHVRDLAIDLECVDGGYRVVTKRTGSLFGRLVVIATGNALPSLRAPFAPEHADHPSIIANPLEPACFDAISPSARTLIVGAGLTSLDVVSTLIRRNHRASITVVSRRGLRPSQHSPAIRGLVQLSGAPGIGKQTAPASEPPAFLINEPASALGWLKALRREITRVEKQGGSWHGPFDLMRDGVWLLWPKLTTTQKLKFLRRLRLYYDVHRFRAPIMNDKAVRIAECDGLVSFEAATLTSVTAELGNPVVNVGLKSKGGPERFQAYDAVINCTGIDATSSSRGNPFIAALLARGMLTPHPTGLGFAVSENCEAQSSDGSIQPMLRVIGPPTLGAFGDPVAAVFIAAQVRRLIPGLIEALGIHCVTPSAAAQKKVAAVAG